MNDYRPYNPSEIEILMHEPWEVSDNPYMLHAAYALSSIYDLCSLDDDEDEKMPVDGIWECSIPQNLMKHLADDIAADFNDAASNRKPVKIWGKSYSIRKVNAYDRNRLHLIFNFPLQGDEYLITKEGILNLAGPTMDALKKYETTCDQAQANRTYLRQIIKLAEDDANNGWDKLTDLEIAVYCWAMFYNKYQFNNWKQFSQEYKDYFYVDEKEIQSCFTEKAKLRQGPVGMYTFDRKKVMEWNEANNQKSYAAEIPQQEAEDYWYDVALKKTFKPIDLR